jgi:hypothetical protein
MIKKSLAYEEHDLLKPEMISEYMDYHYTSRLKKNNNNNSTVTLKQT